MTPKYVEQVVEVRRKNQVTWPSEVAKQMHVREGAKLVIRYDPDRNEASVRALPDTFAGSMRGIYGKTVNEVRAYVRGEQEAWD